MKKHILVVSQYFYPEQFRINDLCYEWINRGYKVTVITGVPNYPQGKFYSGYGWFKKRKEIYNGVEIIRLPIIPRGSNALMLCLNYISFVISGIVWVILTKIKADLVFIFEVSPMTQALPGVWYSKKRRIPCYLYVQDLWPENVEIVTGIRNKYIIGSIGKMVDYIYRNCTKIFTTSKSFVTAINNRGVALDKLEFWPQYAEDFYQPLDKCSVEEIPQDNRFNITFTGNIGVAQGLDILPKVAETLKKQGYGARIRFNIVGDGRYKETLVRMVNSMNVSEMFNFVSRKPATSIPQLLAASDVACLCLTNDPLFNMTIPAKLQSYLACGIPIIASANGETQRIIDESGSGICCPAGDFEAFARAILEMVGKSKDELRQLGQNGRQYYLKHFNKQELLTRMDWYFNKDIVVSEEKSYV